MVTIDFTVCRCPVETSFNITRKSVMRDQYEDDAADTPYLLACAVGDFMDAVIKCWERSDDDGDLETFINFVNDKVKSIRRNTL